MPKWAVFCSLARAHAPITTQWTNIQIDGLYAAFFFFFFFLVVYFLQGTRLPYVARVSEMFTVPKKNGARVQAPTLHASLIYTACRNNSKCATRTCTHAKATTTLFSVLDGFKKCACHVKMCCSWCKRTTLRVRVR